LGGLALGGFDMWFQSIFKFSLFGTVKHGKTDAQSTGKAADYAPIDYPKPDGKLSFDRLTNVSFAMTNHEESQPPHLHLTNPRRADLSELAGLCRAGAALLPGWGL
jgi:electron-transferring-flavoprotein dehydrogenase